MASPRKKKTREEWEREQRETDDLTRRLKERIDYHKARLADQDRREGGEAAPS